MKSWNTEVLVVGAGPVGMFAALNLAREGVRVELIDEASAPAGQSYACALHCRTIDILRTAGLFSSLMSAGRRLEKIVFYEGSLRRTEISLADISPGVPFLLVLPQSELEGILEEALDDEANVNVRWHHRLSSLHPMCGGVVANIDELAGTATGYDVPRWETVVNRSFEVTADFVVGCDGHNSVVRRLAGIEYQRVSSPELFVVYEFDSDIVLADEMRVVLNPGDVNVLWPMIEPRCRWSFQWTDTPPDGEFPAKERNHLWFEEKPIAVQTQMHLKQLLEKRAEWFDGEVNNMVWATDIQFERRLARHFGQGRCWLAGDAAHQTGPVGVQSMNSGLQEAELLARQIRKCLRGTGAVTPMEEYDLEYRLEWQRLLGMNSRLERLSPAVAPALRNQQSLVASLPALGDDLDAMLAALGLKMRAPGSYAAQTRA